VRDKEREREMAKHRVRSFKPILSSS